MMIKLINEILEKMATICKPQRKFIAEVLSIMLSGRGKMNFRNMSRYSTYSEKTFSRKFKQLFNFAEFNQQALAEILKGKARIIAAFDPSFIQKSGNQTYGKAYFWNGSASRAEKGLELGLLSVVDVDHNKAYAISARQTPPIMTSKNKNVVSVVEESRVDAYLKHIAENKKYLPTTVRHLAVDGFFGKEKFVTGIREIGLEIVGKLRIDANLRLPFTGTQKHRGRPRKYGLKIDINDLTTLQFAGRMDNGLMLHTVDAYSISLKKTIRIVLVLNETNKDKVGRALLFSTDLNLSASEIYHFYKARFQIEFVFRDAKQFTGLDDCQARSQSQLDWHFNASFAALNVAKIVDQTTRKSDAIKNTFSMASWKVRFFNEHLMSKFFSMLSIDQSLIKLNPQFEMLRNYGAISNLH